MSDLWNHFTAAFLHFCVIAVIKMNKPAAHQVIYTLLHILLGHSFFIYALIHPTNQDLCLYDTQSQFLPYNYN